MTEWDDSGNIPDDALAQMVIQAVWDIRTRWRNNIFVPIETYLPAFGPGVFARADVYDSLTDAILTAKDEAKEAEEGPPAEGYQALRQLIDPTYEGRDFYAYLDPPTNHGDFGQFGSFRIVRLVGKGGKGTVFEAIKAQTKLNKRRALKILPLGPSFPGIADALAQFKREVETLEKIRDKTNVVSIHDAEIIPHKTLGNVAYIDMEFVYGPTLQGFIEHFRRRGVTPPLQLVVDLIAQTARGLAAAHSVGIAHRDITPRNVLLQWDVDAADFPHWRVRICDFGLAATPDQTPLTETGFMNVTVSYISPEQIRGQRADARTDIFALGLIFYELLLGNHPFLVEGDNNATISRILIAEPESPGKIKRATPVAIEQLILSMLDKDPSNRPPSSKIANVLSQLLVTKDSDKILIKYNVLNQQGIFARQINEDIYGGLKHDANKKSDFENKNYTLHSIDANKPLNSTLMSEPVKSTIQLDVSYGLTSARLDLIRNCIIDIQSSSAIRKFPGESFGKLIKREIDSGFINGEEIFCFINCGEKFSYTEAKAIVFTNRSLHLANRTRRRVILYQDFPKQGFPMRGFFCENSMSQLKPIDYTSSSIESVENELVWLLAGQHFDKSIDSDSIFDALNTIKSIMAKSEC